MTEKTEQLLSKPLTAESMSNIGALKLFEELMEGLRHDYILGKSELIRCYGRDMTEEEFNERTHGKAMNCSDGAVRLYFKAKRTIAANKLGTGFFASPDDIFSTWDSQMYRKYPRTRI